MAERLASAPDVIDHRMIGVGGGIDVVDFRVLAILPREIKRELHTGRGACLRLVDRDLEEIGTALMAQEKSACDRLAAMGQRRDFEAALRRERHRGVADETMVAVMLGEGGAVFGLPAF